jgi:hypothetical protein
VVSRGPAVIATVIALVLINVGLAASIVEAVGARSFAPVWVCLVLLVVGAAAAAAAVVLWRQYLAAVRN